MQDTLLSSLEQLAKRSAWQALVIQFAAGCLLVFAFAPFGQWYLVFPLLFISGYFLPQLTANNAFKQGLAFSLGYFAAGMSWVHISIYNFGGTGLVLATVFTMAFVALLALFPAIAYYLLNRYFHKLSLPAYWLLAWPFCWLLLEWIRSWIFTGLPWLNLGHSQFEGPLAAVMPALGADGASLWVLFIVGCLQLLTKPSSGYIKPLIGLVIVQCCALFLLHQIQWVRPSGETLSVTIIQPNVAQENKWRAAFRVRAMQYLYDTNRR